MKKIEEKLEKLEANMRARGTPACLSYACQVAEIRGQMQASGAENGRAPVGDSLLQTALRNLPQYISKSGLVGPDKHSAMLCFEVLRDALAQQPAADGGFTAADMMDARKEAREFAQQPDYPITATCRVCDCDYRCVPVPAKCGTCGADLPPSAPVGVEWIMELADEYDAKGHHDRAYDLRSLAQQPAGYSAVDVATAAAQGFRDGVASVQRAAVDGYTTGHCERNKQPGGCDLHNLRCGWPACDRRPADQPGGSDND